MSNTQNQTTNKPALKQVKYGDDPLNMLVKKAKKQKEAADKKAIENTEAKSEIVEKPKVSQETLIQSDLNIAFIRKFYTDIDFIGFNSELLPCEKVESYEKVSYRYDDMNSLGILVLTKFRVIFKFQEPKNLEKFQVNDDSFKLPLFSIEKINKIVEKQRNNSEKYAIEITTKDTRVLKFWIWTRDSLKFFGDLNEFVYPSDPSRYFEYSFDYLKYLYNDAKFINGWDLYDVYAEFERQGVSKNNTLQLKYIDDNIDYRQCTSYPEVLIVHEKNTFNEMSDSCLHRFRNRFPVLTYYYNKNNATSSIWRASQSKAGVQGGKSRSNGDIQVIENIISLKKKLYIYDARPYVNALTNRMKGGGGFENVEHYSNTEITLCEIDSIQKTKEAVHKVFALIQNNQM